MKSSIVKFMCLVFAVASVVGAQPGSPKALTPLPSMAPALFDVPMDLGTLGELDLPALSEGLHQFSSDMFALQLDLEFMPTPVPMELASLADLNGFSHTLSNIRISEDAELSDLGDQDDPGYVTYKKGYNLVLEEKWAEARKALGEVGTKFPKSKYVDDAQYWIAYSLKYSDKKKSIEAYKKFLKQYPDSNYYDDAVADLNRLENQNATTSVGYAETPPPSVYSIEALARGVRAAAPAIAPTPAIPPTGVYSIGRSKESDPELRTKIEALYALGRSNRDEKTFELLKETALNKEQPRELREAALDMLRNFKGRDISGLYMELINDDSDRRLQQNALYWIGQLSDGNDEKIFTILKGIAMDRHRSREIRETAFHSLTQMKRGDITSIFIEIAKNDPDKRVQQSALYYIIQSARRGNEDKVFQILKEFALDQKQNREVRESAFHSLKEFRRGDVLGIFLEIAKNDPDERIRSSALYYVGQVGEKDPDKVFNVYKEFLLDQKQPKNTRESAMYSLSSLRHPEALNLLLQVAKSDPNEQIQQSAIYYIGQLSTSKSKNLETLILLFDATPKDRTRALESVLYAVASIGNDQAVDFLSKVAKTSESYEMRRRAVYYLGNIGGDKARAVLLDILKSK
ncbi:MAG: HEAT repeat domain-containing protein [Ignavibacteriales bacterium]|nr:HEAT repeat domain-containing protein [Ignavibacteriales bacterium]